MTQRYQQRMGWILLLGLTAGSLAEIGWDPALLGERGGRFFDIARAMLPPDWGFFREAAGPLLSTVRMSLAGSFLGSSLGLLGAVLGSRWTNPHSWIRIPFLCAIQLLRTVPALILALLCTFLVGLGNLAGTLALTLSTFGVMTRLGYEDMETLDWKTARALEASGCGRGKAFCRALLPRLLPGYLTNALYLWESNVRQAAILGYVGAGGIGLLLNQQLAWRAYGRVGTLLVLLYGAVLVSESLSEALGSAAAPGFSGNLGTGRKWRHGCGPGHAGGTFGTGSFPAVFSGKRCCALAVGRNLLYGFPGDLGRGLGGWVPGSGIQLPVPASGGRFGAPAGPPGHPYGAGLCLRPHVAPGHWARAFCRYPYFAGVQHRPFGQTVPDRAG